jgi:hypothetical protein
VLRACALWPTPARPERSGEHSTEVLRARPRARTRARGGTNENIPSAVFIFG